MVAPVASALNCPLVVTFYGFDVSELARKPTWQREYKRLWSTVRRVTVLSAEMKERVVELGCPREIVEVIHLSRDLSHFTFSPPNAPIRRFLSVGRLTEKKGHFTALRALKKVRDIGHDIQLDIVGEGPLQAEIESFIQEQGLNEAVRLHGAVPNQQVLTMMENADAFLLCSETSPSGDKEGTPTVLIEAQAMGLPCVTTRHAGIPEMIPRGNHFLLAEEGVVEQVARCIEDIVSLETRELSEVSERGQEKIQSEFSLSSEVSKLIKLYSVVKRDGKVRL
jgi:glycosyltransferase involved in cell wall biosynthesis